MRKAQEYRPRLDARKVKAFQARLLAWFRQNGRDLPWRRTRDPYKILVSEVMLQLFPRRGETIPSARRAVASGSRCPSFMHSSTSTCGSM